MTLSTSLELNPSLKASSSACIATLSGLVVSGSAASPGAAPSMATQSAVRVRILVSLQMSANCYVFVSLSRLRCGVERKRLSPTLKVPKARELGCGLEHFDRRAVGGERAVSGHEA